MSDEALTIDGWTLRESTATDIPALMRWFPEAEDINIWGGPVFRFPFTPETFLEDVHWGRMLSYSLCDPCGEFAAFGQLYDRDGRIHLARLVVNPAMRGAGVGKRLINMLMTVGQAVLPGDEFSLFVFRDNVIAYKCYISMGFVVRDYPNDMPHANVCYYLTKASQKQRVQKGE
jgi:ribosomal protein S18 acetylase RimI-like enzyme